MVDNTTVNYEEIYSEEILNAMDPSRMYPVWIKKWSGYHYEKAECDCGCECCCEEELVPDKDAIEYDVWIPYGPTLWSLLPKKAWSAEHK